MIDTTIAVFIAILTFASGLILGYVEGWESGSQQGYSVGWVSANAEIRRLMARTKGEGS